MDLMETGVISTTRKVNCVEEPICTSISDGSLGLSVQEVSVSRLTIQLEPEAKAAAGARIGNGAYSDGKSHGIARRPIAKKKLGGSSFWSARYTEMCLAVTTHLKRNSMVAATIPVALKLTEVVPANTAMQQH